VIGLLGALLVSLAPGAQAPAHLPGPELKSAPLFVQSPGEEIGAECSHVKLIAMRDCRAAARRSASQSETAAMRERVTAPHARLQSRQHHPYRDE
jgi:hypothetical protein